MSDGSEEKKGQDRPFVPGQQLVAHQNARQPANRQLQQATAREPLRGFAEGAQGKERFR